MKTQNTFAFVALLALAAGCAYNEPQPKYGTVPVYRGDVISTRVVYPPSTPAPAYSVQTQSAVDQELVTTVRHQFDRYGDLSGLAPNIQISALNGAVTLNGSVPNERDRQMIMTMVRNTPGVVEVNDQLHVADLQTTNVPQSDRELADQVRRELNGQVAPWARNIRVDAYRGIVTLSGNVPSPQDRQYVESVVRSTAGVSGIINQLQVLAPTGNTSYGSGSYPATTGDIFNLHVQGLTETDRTLAQRILQGLQTDTAVADTMIASPQPVVDINVSDGRVVLQGTVQSEQQRRTIVSAVRRAAGSGNVIDQLRVPRSQ